MKKKLKILIPNATSPLNLGDQVMLKELLKLLKSTHGNGEITIHSTDPHLYKQNAQYRVDHTLYSWAVFSNKNPLVRAMRMYKLFLEYILNRINFNKIIFDKKLHKLINDYKRADLIVYVGNGYVRSQKGIKQALNLFMLLVLFEFSRFSNRKKIAAPMSFGPFAYSWQEKIAGLFLNHLNIVSAREEISYKRMQKNNIKNIILSSDHALFLKRKSLKKKRNARFVLGFTIRKWFGEKRQSELEDKIVNGLAAFSKLNDLLLQPIIQVDAPEYGDNDVDIMKEIVIKLKLNGCKVLPVKNASDLKNAITIYSEIDLLLGMRMHSNIIAATQGTPFVALSYEHKTEGITKQLGMEEYSINCEVINEDNLVALLTKAHQNKSILRKIITSRVSNIQNKEQERWSKILKEYKRMYYDN